MALFDFFKKDTEHLPAKERKQALQALIAELDGNAAADEKKYPEHHELIHRFHAQLKEVLTHSVYPKGQAEFPPVDATVRVCLTEDRMHAYACLLPPVDGGTELTEDGVMESLHYDGIISGIQSQTIAEHLRTRRYLHIFPIAHGTAPEDGKDETVKPLIEGRPLGCLEISADTVPNFKDPPFVLVQAGDKICRIQAGCPGKHGEDVTGHSLPCHEMEKARIPQGTNTRLTADGQFLVSNRDGVLYVEDERFSVSPAQIISGPIAGSDSPIQVRGDLYIKGDVLAGADVSTTGNLVIEGKVQSANLTSGGTIWVQKGIRGSEKTSVHALRQLQAATLNAVTAEAGDSVFADVIEDSFITAGSCVIARGSRGLILGGHIKARNQVVCERIGNLSGRENTITVGYVPEIYKRLEGIETELGEINGVLDKLRKSVIGLRQGGETLSPEKRELLGRLVEQRKLYEERDDVLQKEKKELRAKLRSALSGSVHCTEMYPVTVVHIGDRENRFTVADRDCNIHYYAGQVVTK